MRIPLIPALTALISLPAAEPAPAVAGPDDAPPPVIVDAPPIATVPVGESLADLALLDQHLWVQAVSRRRQPVSESPQSVIVIGTDDFIRSPAATLPDLLRYEPGVDVYQERHAQFDIGLRGWTGLATPRTLAVRDGRPFAFETTGQVPWVGALHVSEIERIEVIKGPASVTYGSNAFGGAIAVSTFKPGDDWTVRAIAGVGDHGHRELDATAAGPLPLPARWPRFDFKASAGLSERNDLPGERGAAPAPKFAQAGRTWERDLESRRAAATIGVGDEEILRAELGYRLLDMPVFEMIEDLSTGSNLTSIRQHEVGLRLRMPGIEAEWWRRDFTLDYQNQKSVFQPANAYMFDQVGSDDVRDTVRAQADTELGPLHLTTGGEYSRWESRSNAWTGAGVYADRASWGEVETENRAGFGEVQWRVAPGWTVNAGVRLDDHDLVGSNVSPRLGLNRRFADGSFARLGLLSGYRMPVPLEAYTDEYYFTIDDGIEAETIRALDAEWRGTLGPVRVGFSGFYSRGNDLLVYLPLDQATMQANWNSWFAAYAGGDFTRQPGPFFSLGNLDNPVDLFGAETDAEVTVGQDWRLWANATLQRYRHDHETPYESAGVTDLFGNTWFRFAGVLPRDFNEPPPLKASAGVRWQSGPWFAGTAVRYVASRTVFSVAASEYRVPPPAGIPVMALQEVPWYLAVDACAGYYRRLRRDRAVFVRLSGLNLLADDHHETYEANVDTLVRGNEDQQGSEIGRSLVLSLGMQF